MTEPTATATPDSKVLTITLDSRDPKPHETVIALFMLAIEKENVNADYSVIITGNDRYVNPAGGVNICGFNVYQAATLISRNYRMFRKQWAEDKSHMFIIQELNGEHLIPMACIYNDGDVLDVSRPDVKARVKVKFRPLMEDLIATDWCIFIPVGEQ